MTGALAPELRKQLEKVVRSARAEGEAGARAALRALAVGAARPHESMLANERGLRLRLRAHGRQLGDALDRESGEQEIGRLVHEVAYEHWHRMLFARFLAENGLLVEPRSGVSVSLDECGELARESGATDGWQVAEGFAAEMLPQIFRPGDPALAVTLAPETRQALERLVEDLPAVVFTASDALGWTYQFWQADRKDEVNRAGAKIGADELPAVTQLFTENYMVRFLFHNTLGAWRAGKVLAERPELAEGAASEGELTAAARIEPRGGLDGYDFEYLRFVREPAADGDDAPAAEADPPRDADLDGRCADGSAVAAPVWGESGPWRPAAGVFGRWPRRTADLRVLDPSCGSGHFLVEGFELLVRLRMEEEGLGIEEAVRAVLRDNLFGLEIDPRCTQIAAFSLALTAWRTVGRPIELPPLQIACSGLAPSASKDDWLRLAEGDQRLEGTLDLLHDLFRQAPVLGSLIDPAGVGEELFQADYATAERALSRAVAQEDAGDDERERAVAAQGISRAARLLAGEYDLVITNVPYLARGKQAASLQNFALKSHPDAKADLATIFVLRILRWLGAAGVQAVVAPQNWLFLTSYRKLRERLLSDRTWRVVARLGPGAFETISGHVVNVAMAVLSAERPDDDWCMAGIDVSAPRGEVPIPAREKAELLAVRPDGSRFKHEFCKTRALTVAQRAQLLSPDGRVSLRDSPLHEPLQRCASSVHGLGSKDTPCFFRQFWEVASQEFRRRSVWEPLQTTVDSSLHFGGAEQVVLWEQHSGLLAARGKRGEAVLAGRLAWGRSGVLVSLMGKLSSCLYFGEKFDKNTAAVIPDDGVNVSAVWCFCSTAEFAKAVRELDQKMNVTNATLAKVPFDLERWSVVAGQEYPNGLPEPYSDDPTQWLYHGHPCGSVVWDEDTKWTAHGPLRTEVSVLHVAVARLLGYRWPAELDPDMRLAAESREWVERCRDLHEFADADGIVCLQAAAGELPAADRLRSLLSAAYGEEWFDGKERQLLTAAANGRKPPGSISEWLRDRFFAEHCKLFHNRPFVWHVWDGRKDGFHALINCHRLCGPDDEGRRTLEALAFRHLGEWIDRQRAAQSQGEEGADARLAAALDLQHQLELILKGEPPYDLFVRWRPLHEQPIGWAPNLDDGVRLNIRPFVRAELQAGGLKGAGILRARPNVKWGKDRGREPESLRPSEDFPWFYSCPGLGSEADRTDYTASLEAAYDGSRWNDLHYTRGTKEAAHARHEACER